MKVLVDFENVNSPGLQGIKSLTGKDDLIIFYSDTSRISFDLHRQIESLECKKDYQKISTENQNALNFLLSTIIGRLIALDSRAAYAIITKDDDFDVIINYWKSKGINISRKDTIRDAVGTTAVVPDDEVDEVEPEEVVNELFSKEENPAIDINNLLNTRLSENNEQE
jgi:hypothetical protein